MSQSRPHIQLSDLPPELLDLIWEQAMPAPRLFHVASLKAASPPTSPPTRRPRFHLLHPPPAITAICAGSRRAARRLGLFLLPISAASDPDAAVWFSSSSDVLYLDRSVSTGMTRGSVPPALLQDVDRVHRVGIEWRHLFRDGSLSAQHWADDAYALMWVWRMSALYTMFPGMTHLHYVLPRTRYQGGIPWGREPDGAATVEGHLAELPGRITIPLESGHVSWERLRTIMRTALERPDVVQGLKDRRGDVHFPPEVVGQWLLRDRQPTAFESPSVKEFTW